MTRPLRLHYGEAEHLLSKVPHRKTAREEEIREDDEFAVPELPTANNQREKGKVRLAHSYV